MTRVYVETSVPSLLVARPSHDLITAGRQLMTVEWWATAAERFELVVSELVLDEMGRGEPEMARRRLEAVQGLPVLPVNQEARALAEHYRAHLGLADNALLDMLHLAIAVRHELDCLVTWNLRHLANAHVIGRLHRLNEQLGVRTPLILTPAELGPAPRRNN